MAKPSQFELSLTRRRAAGQFRHSPDDSPEKCRQRRRRRIEMRRARPNWAPAQPPRKRREAEDEDEEEDYDDLVTAVAAVSMPRPRPMFLNSMPIFSNISIKGVAERSNVVGSAAVFVQENFCPPEVFSGGEALHFFAVYHGHASTLYKQLLHRFVAEELASADQATASNGDSGKKKSHRDWWNDQMVCALRRGFQRVDRVVVALLDQATTSSASSSAATVAILTAEHIVVATRGGASRAVLRSDGVPIPLCPDRQPPCNHKYSQGPSDQPRPLGKKAMRSSSTRTKTEVEIFMIERSREEDECLILGSDSVWDFMSDETACNVAKNCVKDRNKHSHETCNNNNTGVMSIGDDDTIMSLDDDNDNDYDDDAGGGDGLISSIDAASLLCRLALGRGSTDGISVIVVDLSQ